MTSVHETDTELENLRQDVEETNGALHEVHTKSYSSWISILFRSIGLQFVNATSFWRQPLEPAKVALHRNRKAAFLRLTVHVVPVLAALTLIIVNAVVIRMDKTSWYNTFQFVAKVHEIAMQASIAAIVMSYVRFTLLNSAPFSSIFAGIQTANLSYLWSLEFLGSITAAWMSLAARALFVLVILVCFLLASTVGPSSAILMMPRAGVFDLDMRPLLTSSTTSVLPTTSKEFVSGFGLQEVVFFDMDDRAGETKASKLRSGGRDIPFISGVDWLSDPDQKQVAIENHWTGYLMFSTMLPLNWTSSLIDAATVQQGFLNFYSGDVSNPFDAIKPQSYDFLIKSRGDPILEFDTYVAVTNATISNLDASPHAFYGIDLDRRVTYTTPDDEVIDFDLTEGDVLRGLREHGNHFKVFLLDFDGTTAQNISGLAFLAINTTMPVAPNATNPAPVALGLAVILQCSWLKGQMRSTWSTWSTWESMSTVWRRDHDHITGLSSADSGTHLKIDKDWVEKLPMDTDIAAKPSKSAIQTIEEYFSLVMENDLQRAAQWTLDPTNEYFGSYPANLVSNHLPRAARSLAALVASGMSTAQPMPDFNASYPQYCPTGGPSRHVTDLPEDFEVREFVKASDAWCIQVHAFADGVGYSLHNTSARFATAILAIYCLVVAIHVVFSLIHRVSSNSWDSASEITALALRSKVPAKKQGHVTAGLSTVNVFREAVTIKENQEAELELIFARDVTVASRYEDMTYNKWY